MDEWSATIEQSYAKGFYHTDFAFISKSDEINLGCLQVSSTASIPNVYNVVARYYRNNMTTTHGNKKITVIFLPFIMDDQQFI